MTRNTVAETLTQTSRNGNGALIGYLPIGYPDLATSIDAACAMVEAGVDILELGVPYSDPVMDGPVIQEATVEALNGGFKLSDVFVAVREITQRVEAPVLVMTYWNPVLQYGPERFASDLAAAGGAGLITPDLVPDEAAQWLEVSEQSGLERVFLAAPTSTDERIDQATSSSRGFVYAVSTMGVTGTRAAVDDAAQKLVERLKARGCEHACVGLGISTADQVAEVLTYADGAIVGSAFVRALREGGVEKVREVASMLSKAKTR